MRTSKPWILLTGFAAFAALAATTPPPNLSQAVEAQRALTVERPQDDAAINDLGNLLRMAGRVEEAETAYRQAIELAPEKVAPRYNLGILLQQQGEAREALEQYRRVTELDPAFAWAHYQIGALLEAKGNEAQALKAYSTAFVLNPELAFPQVNPQVIDNGLLQEALLASYKQSKKAPPPQAPNTYADPKHVASLFVPPPAAEPSRAPAPAPAAAGGRTSGSISMKGAGGQGSGVTGATPRGGVARSTSPGAVPPSRVLSGEDLDDRPVGQVTGGAAAGGRGGARASTSRTQAGGAAWSWPRNQNGSGKPTAGGSAGGTRATFAPPARPTTGNPQPTPTIVRPGGFKPGINSTGRLENRLLPARPAPAPERVGP